VIPIGGVAALLFAAYLAAQVLRKDAGTEKMREIADAIAEGANAFMHRQYKTIGALSIVLAIILFFITYLATNFGEGCLTGFAFITGAGCSAIAGYIGMYVSVRANVRCASGARRSLNEALTIALRGGAVSGLLVVGMSLLGVAAIYYLYTLLLPLIYPGFEPQYTPLYIVAYGFGASFVALFAQLGGGIYTKAADVGADLVGKVEAGIPEDDPRNPAVIADLVGDNVGDCAGRGADLFESTAAENIGAMILGIALYPAFGINGVLFPLVARAFGIFASIVGIMTVKVREDEENPMRALSKGYWITSLLAALLFGFAAKTMLSPSRDYLLAHPEVSPHTWLLLFFAGLVGMLMSISFVYITDYYTSYQYAPVKRIAQSSETGAATNIITGLSVGLECTALPVVTISASLLVAYLLGAQTGLEHGGLYGTAIATMGMLATCAYILAMDTFGPIADNANGIIEMAGISEEVRDITDRLDAVGNTTKALTKGYAIGSAGLAAFLLFQAYIDKVKELGFPIDAVNIAKPAVFVGGFVGVMIVFLFSALAIRAVGKAAYYVINEVRRQFREIPGIMEGTTKPNYARCVDIVTRGALKEMIPPGMVAVAGPAVVGVVFKYLYPETGIATEVVASLLMMGTIGGGILATMKNNGGGARDNAKKYIESRFHGGKGSEPHKASVVGDTVGDPLKDTAGPSLHVLVKLLSTITLVLAPLFI